MKLKRITSGIMSAVMAVTVVGTPVGDMIPAIGETLSAAAESTDIKSSTVNAAGYSYTITPLLAPFNQYFFVQTDNPDPLSFRFTDKSTKYDEEEQSIIKAVWDTWDDEPTIFQDIKYQNAKTGRVDGGYIFYGYYTDGGEVVLQVANDDGYDVTWEDTNVKCKLPALKDSVDYLIDTYAKKSSFFDNMDAVEDGFSSICLYSGSYILGELTRVKDYWGMSTSPHKDQTFYLQSPYSREGSKPLFASAIYPYRYDSLGFPSVLSVVARRLDTAAEISWNADNHYLVDVTYNGETYSYGGQGNGEGKGLSEDKIKKYFTFGSNGTEITLNGSKQLLDDYAKTEMKDDIPRSDALTWENICDTVGDGAWVRLIKIAGIFGATGTTYTYLYKSGDGDEFYTDSAGDNGSEIYWFGDLGYVSDTWVDGRYIDDWERYVPGAKYEDHKYSNILLKRSVPQIEYDVDYEYNCDKEEYELKYTINSIQEKKKNVLYWYNSENKLWTASFSAFDEGCADYDLIKRFVDDGLIDKSYLNECQLTADDVAKLKVDRNTNKVPDDYYIYDRTTKPGTSLKNHTHNYVTEKVVKPTYTAQGYTLHKCTICGADKKDNYTAKLTLAKVGGAKLTGRAADALRINWTKNANADGYIIEMYQNGKWARVAKITNNSTTTFRKAGLSASTVYKFRVRAYKMSGSTAVYSAYSNELAARTNPSVMKGAKLGGRAADALRINWTKNASADGYIVEMYQGNKWVRVAKITNSNTTTFRKAGLKASTVYKFRVRAYKMSGKTALYGNYSATVTARTNPSIMKGVKIGGKAKDALRVNWSKNTSAQGYIVEMYKGGKWVRVAKITNNSTTTFRKAGLAKNTAYKFRVRAYHMSGKTALYGNYGSVSGKTAAK